MEEFIKLMVKELESGISFEQIKREVWSYCLREYANVVILDAIIYKSMDVYAAIIYELNRTDINNK